jgi:hypothetical protein
MSMLDSCKERNESKKKQTVCNPVRGVRKHPPRDGERKKEGSDWSAIATGAATTFGVEAEAVVALGADLRAGVVPVTVGVGIAGIPNERLWCRHQVSELEIVDGGLDLGDEVIVGQVGETPGQVGHGLLLSRAMGENPVPTR